MTQNQEPVQAEYAGRKANKMPVVYNRQQTPHSVVKHILFGWLLLWIPTIYYAVSPNHYYKL